MHAALPSLPAMLFTRLRAFAECHVAMLWWLAGVAVTAIGVTLVLWSGVAGGTYALLAIPFVILAGVAAGMAELIQALRRRDQGLAAIAYRVAGTVALGAFAVPFAAAATFGTVSVVDCATIVHDFARYQQVVAKVRAGTIAPSPSWQAQDDVQIIVETTPETRIVFAPERSLWRRAIVYDPGGSVMTPIIPDPSRPGTVHHVGDVEVSHCRSTPISAYYRCDLWQVGDEDG